MGSSLAMRHFLSALGKQVTNIVPTSFPDFLAWLPGVEAIVQYEQNPEAAAQALRDADLVICTDIAEPGRVAALSDILAERFSAYESSQTACKDGENARNNGENADNASLLIIDHHLSSVCSNHPEQIAYPDSASASELVFRLVYQIVQDNRAVIEGISSQCRECFEPILDNTRDHHGTISLRHYNIDVPFDAILTPDFATCIYTGMMTDTGSFAYNSNSPPL